MSSLLQNCPSSPSGLRKCGSSPSGLRECWSSPSGLRKCGSSLSGLRWWWALAGLLGSVLVVTPAWAATNLISGQVLDRNGRPMVRAIVSLTPGPEGCPEGGGCTVELVTDRDGRFVINYLRDKTGEKIKLARKTEYRLEVFKAGYHTFTTAVPYRRGELPVEPVTMVEETIDVQDFPENLDPQLYTKATQSSGATYEGQ